MGLALLEIVTAETHGVGVVGSAERPPTLDAGGHPACHWFAFVDIVERADAMIAVGYNKRHPLPDVTGYQEYDLPL
jgi:hypothetical protein